jgi:lipid-A-disaccharide synthase
VAGPHIFLSAGEPSGDLHGGAVARAIRQRWPDARMLGLGGPNMQAAGVELLAELDDLAVMGLAEVAGRLPFFMGLDRRVRAQLRREPPDLVIPIDYPGFNFRLCHHARAIGRRVLYYIAPQVWAWRKRRARTLARVVDRLAVILPFEEALFASYGARTVYVGHPLLDAEPPRVSREAFCATIGADAQRPILALFPGSRVQEVERHIDVFTQAAKEVSVYHPNVQPVIAAGSAIPESYFAGSTLPRTGDAWGLLQHAEAAIVKSGTTTLQAALCRTPMVVAYRMNPLTFRVARRVVRVPHVGLVNLVAGDRIVPELLQDEATPIALCEAIVPFVDPQHPARTRALADLQRVRERLRAHNGEASVAERVVALAAELISA